MTVLKVTLLTTLQGSKLFIHGSEFIGTMEQLPSDIRNAVEAKKDYVKVVTVSGEDPFKVVPTPEFEVQAEKLLQVTEENERLRLEMVELQEGMKKLQALEPLATPTDSDVQETKKDEKEGTPTLKNKTPPKRRSRTSTTKLQKKE